MKQLGIFAFLRKLGADRSAQRGANPHQVVIYTRNGCHLCEDAAQLVRQHGICPQMVDIDANAELRERFDCCVPVVEIDGKIRFRGLVNGVLLRRLLAHSTGP
ncbi:MAG: glutaredoxin family protein [Planctomycetaceae bacterium]|nr:glutaredoxin family protein [Planctomycetaceae bacterium]